MLLITVTVPPRFSHFQVAPFGAVPVVDSIKIQSGEFKVSVSVGLRFIFQF